MRNFLDNEALQLLRPILQAKTGRSFCNVASLGPGRCFQETVIITKLARLIQNIGNRQLGIHLTLIEQDPEVPLVPLLQYCEEVLPNTTIKVSHCRSLESYIAGAKRKQEPPDLFLGIDLSDDVIEGRPLQQYALDQLRANELIRESTVTAITEFELSARECIREAIVQRGNEEPIGFLEEDPSL